MNQDLPQPYGDFLYIEPLENKQVLGNALKTIGKVLAKGPDCRHYVPQEGPVVDFTKVGDYVAFELWDKPEFTLKDGKTCHFVREKDLICRLPESWAV